MSGKVGSSATETAPPTSRQTLFTFNPPPLQRNDSVPPPIPSAPLHFLDRHIPECLILKRVRIIPSLHLDLYTSLEAYTERLDALRPEDFIFHSFMSYDEITSADARSIFRIRSEGAEVASSRIASKLILHPTQPNAFYFLRWQHALEELKPTVLHEKYATQYLGLRVVGGSPERYEELNRKNRVFIKRLYERMKQLVSPLILCTDALPILEDMTRVGTMDAFPWRLDSHYHGVPCPRSPPPDALETLWTLPDERGPRRSRRVKQASKRTTRPQDIGLPDIAENSGEYKPLCEDYIQKVCLDNLVPIENLCCIGLGSLCQTGHHDTHVRLRKFSSLWHSSSPVANIILV